MDALHLTLGDIRLEISGRQAQELRRQLEMGAPSPSGDGDPNEVLTTAEVAPLLGCSAKYVRSLCALPKADPRFLKHVRKGREILVRRQDVTGWIARQIEE